MMRKKIMIIDDNSEFLDELKETMDLSGYDTERFSDGETALRCVEEFRPDAILLDLKMSGKSGFQVADLLTNQEHTSHIPIIAMTGFFKEKEHELLMKTCGIKTCLLKPFNPLDVIAEIEHLLKGEKGRLESVVSE